MKRTRLFSELVLIAALTATVHGDTFFGLEHSAIGDADLTGPPSGPLAINNLGSTGKDGVEVRLPPIPPHRTMQTVWEVDLATADLTFGSTMLMVGVGDDGSGVESVACSAYIDMAPGAPTITFDFSGAAPVSLGARYYANGELILEETGVSPVAAPIGGFPPAIPSLCGSVHFDPTIQQWVLDGCLALERTLGGTPLPAVDYWEIFTEGATVHHDRVAAVRMTTTGISQLTVNGETVTLIPVPSGCPGDADGDFDVDFDDLNAVLGNWGGSGPVADVHPAGAPDGVVNFDDLNAVLANWGSACP